MGNKPLITVVTVCYQTVNEIEKTILSVLRQTYSDIEYIIIDGGSSDGTVDTIRKYANRLAYWVSEPDGGIYDAMNKGIAKASGEWINFMNAGDEFFNEKTIENVFNQNRFDNSVEVIYGNTMFNDGLTRNIQNAYPLKAIKHCMPFCHQACFVRLRSMQPFDLTYKIASDYNFFYMLYWKKGAGAFYFVNECIAIFDCVNGVSSKQLYNLTKETLAICSQHKDLKWYYYKIKFSKKYRELL